MAPIIFCCISPFAWCSRWLITTTWNLSTNVSWSSSTLWALPGYQLSSWWEIPSLHLMICVTFDHLFAFRSTQTCSCFELYLEIPTIQHLFFITLEYYHLLVSRMLWGLLHLLKSSWYSDTTHHHHSFMVLVLIPTGVPTSERCCLDSAYLATLLLWS